jgi:hypothetical protein
VARPLEASPGALLPRHLPELSFHGIVPEALEAAVAQVALPNLSLLHICSPSWGDHMLRAVAVASLFRTAAGMDPVEFGMVLVVHPSDQLAVPVVVPSFARAKSIRLDVGMLHLAPPALDGGGFPALERLSITHSRLDADALISQCSHLRVLELINCWDLDTDTITINSATIEELLVMDEDLSVVDIVAPVLKKLTLHTCLSAYYCWRLWWRISR